MALVPLVSHSMFVPPVPMAGFVSMMDQSPQGQDVLQTMLRSPPDFVNQYFESDKVKVDLFRFVAETFVDPEEKGRGMGVFSLPGLMHGPIRVGIAVGGSGALKDALIRCLKGYGAELRTESEVTKVLVEGGKPVGVKLKNGERIHATSCVVGQFHPWVLPSVVDNLDPRVAANAKRTTPAPIACTCGHPALKEAPSYLAGEEPTKAVVTSFAPSSLAEFR